MAKKDERIPIDERIPSIDTPWDNGTSAYTGARVEEFIKDRLSELAQGSLLVQESLSAMDGRIADAESGTVFDMDAEPHEGGVTLTLRSKTGVIADCEIPALGGGSSDVDATSIRLTASVDHPSVLEGGSARLTYTYDVTEASSGMSTGQAASITVQIKRGETVTYERTQRGITPGTYGLDVSPYLLVGSNDIYVTAEFYDSALDKTRAKRAWTQVKAVSLHLSSAFSLTPQLQSGGYATTAQIPFTVSGEGQKRVYLYIDGQQTGYKDVSAAAPTSDSFTVDLSGLTAGMHSAQIVCRLVLDGTEYTSESVWMTLLRSGGQSKMAAAVLTDKSGAVKTGGSHLQPSLTVKSFEELELAYGVYDPAAQTAQAEILVDGSPVSSVVAGRTQQTYRHRFTSEGSHTLTIKCGTARIDVGVTVEQGAVSIQETLGDLTCKLSAAGRSNDEANPAVWTDRGVTTAFEGVDWRSSGWTGKSLRLINGAKATVGLQPFAADNGITGARAHGLTVEVTMTVSSITDENAPILSCLDGGKGLRVMGNEIALLTGQTVTYLDEDEQEQTRECKLSTNYVDGKRMKVAWVIRPAVSGGLNNRVMELYIDGDRAGADTYEPGFSFEQPDPSGLVFDSAGASIEIETIRVYSRALTDDECIANDIYDEPDSDTMAQKYEDNDILDSGGAVDFNKIRRKGKGTLLIVHVNPDHTQYGDFPLGDVYATNNKDTDFTADVYYYSALGTQYDFVLRGCYIRIQGTSSTKYPSKNIRIYVNKGAGSGKKPQGFSVGGVATTDYRYSLAPGVPAQGVITAKSDYSDSSMSLNTGGAKLFHAAMLELGLLTPPQRWQRDHGQEVTARQAIYGMPVDMFVAESADQTPVYAGQYNLNNEKSKSAAVFGMELEGYTPGCPIALESLNNLNKLCLFQVHDLDADMEAYFDSAYEFNYPEDVFWSQSTVDGKVAKGKTATLATATQRAALNRLMQFIKDSVPAGADPSDITTFASPYFREHAAEYFDMQHLLTYYDFTDRLVSVDQRAKNIIWRTWDGLIWYATYYDGDTARGNRNDSFMVYGPETDRDTWDSERRKFAFEGHDSWLWCLCLANFADELKAASTALGQTLTVQRVLAMLLDEQSGNWSARAFNKSGEMKYITPAIRTTYGKTWPFIFALQGSDRSHSEWFIRERWKLMDAKYVTDSLKADCLPITLSRAASDPTDYITVEMSKVYASGYGTNNVGFMYSTGIIRAGVPARMPINVALNANDPLNVYGASRIRRIDLRECYQRMQGSFDLSKAVLLEELDASVPQGAAGYSVAWWLSGIGECRLLRRIDLTGQADASTSGSGRVLNLEGLVNLRELRAKGTRVTDVALEPGAAVRTLSLPGTLTRLSLDSLHSLTDEGLDVDSLAAVTDLTVAWCEGIDDRTLVSRWLSQAASPQRLTLRGVRWTGVAYAELEAIAAVRTLDLEGTAALAEALTPEQARVLVGAFGTDCFGGNGRFTITAPGNFLVAAPGSVYEGASRAEALEIPVIALVEGITDVAITVTAPDSVHYSVDQAARTVSVWSDETGTDRTVEISVTGMQGGQQVRGGGSLRVKTLVYPSDFTLSAASAAVYQGDGVAVTLNRITPPEASDRWTVEWSLSGELADNNDVYISSQTRDGCVVTAQPDSGLSTFTATATVRKGNSSPLATVSINIKVSHVGAIMDSETNPEVLAVCYAQGWCASPEYMTAEEAAAVTDDQLGLTFQGNKDITHFDELQYFTGLADLMDAAFQSCMYLESVTLPPLLQSMYGDSFGACHRLQTLRITAARINPGTDYMSTGYRVESGLTLIVSDRTTEIGRLGLCFTYCTTLKFESMTAPTLTADPFFLDNGSYIGRLKYVAKVCYIPQGATGYTGGHWDTLRNVGFTFVEY